MIRTLIGRGAAAGAAAGIAAFAVERAIAEPQIQKAIAYESARDAAQAALDRAAGLGVSAPSDELFSRTVQADIGAGVGLVLMGVAMGVLVAVAFVVCAGRTGRLRPRTLALLLAGAGFLGVYLVPFLKYPANPPSIGHAETIGSRSALYLAMVSASLVLLAIAVRLGQSLRCRLGTWNATLVSGAAFVLAIGIVMVLLPTYGDLAYNRAQHGHLATETPQPLRDAHGAIVFPGFPADVLFNFRIASVAVQAILWSTLGLVFAPLAERVLGPKPDRRPTEQTRVLV